MVGKALKGWNVGRGIAFRIVYKHAVLYTHTLRAAATRCGSRAPLATSLPLNTHASIAALSDPLLQLQLQPATVVPLGGSSSSDAVSYALPSGQQGQDPLQGLDRRSVHQAATWRGHSAGRCAAAAAAASAQ